MNLACFGSPSRRAEPPWPYNRLSLGLSVRASHPLVCLSKQATGFDGDYFARSGFRRNGARSLSCGPAKEAAVPGDCSADEVRRTSESAGRSGLRVDIPPGGKGARSVNRSDAAAAVARRPFKLLRICRHWSLLYRRRLDRLWDVGQRPDQCRLRGHLSHWPRADLRTAISVRRAGSRLGRSSLNGSSSGIVGGDVVSGVGKSSGDGSTGAAGAVGGALFAGVSCGVGSPGSVSPNGGIGGRSVEGPCPSAPGGLLGGGGVSGASAGSSDSSAAGISSGKAGGKSLSKVGSRSGGVSASASGSLAGVGNSSGAARAGACRGPAPPFGLENSRT